MYGTKDMKNKNIITVRNLIRCLNIDNLRNYEVVSNLVRTFGIMPWVHTGMPLSGPEEIFVNPTGMAAIGQTPNQIAKALVYLSDFKIHSFCEIGICYGGNFLFMSEYLRRFNPDIECTGVDPSDYLDSEVKEIIDAEGWLHYEKVISDEIAGRKFDLVFIDADHTKEWIVRDYDNVGRYAHICMFHDVQETLWPDAVVEWNKLKSITDKEVMEFLDCEVGFTTHGIGMIHDRELKR
jgi:hypothetical protein